MQVLECLDTLLAQVAIKLLRVSRKVRITDHLAERWAVVAQGSDLSIVVLTEQVGHTSLLEETVKHLD